MVNKVSLRYFTGTGNSKRILEIIKLTFEKNGWVVSFCPLEEDSAIDSDSNDYLGFAFPVYSWGVPRIVRKYLENLPILKNGQKVFVIVTSGGKDEEGWALIEARKILISKGYVVTNSDAVNMPNNWIVMSNPPTGEDIKILLEKGEKQAEIFASQILSGTEGNKAFTPPKIGLLARILNYSFKQYGVNRLWRSFRTSPKCSSCGLCSAICPTKSISMKDGSPQWSAKCEQCMRCMNFCPEKAIEQLESIGKGSRRARYHEPHFNPRREA
jgi:ferredoxin